MSEEYISSAQLREIRRLAGKAEELCDEARKMDARKQYAECPPGEGKIPPIAWKMQDLHITLNALTACASEDAQAGIDYCEEEEEEE